MPFVCVAWSVIILSCFCKNNGSELFVLSVVTCCYLRCVLILLLCVICCVGALLCLCVGSCFYWSLFWQFFAFCLFCTGFVGASCVFYYVGCFACCVVAVIMLSYAIYCAFRGCFTACIICVGLFDLSAWCSCFL